MNRKCKKIAAFLSKYLLSNLLALFLVGLSVAEGEEAIHQFPKTGIHLDVSDFDYLDFPTSLSRTQSSSQQSRDMLLPVFYLRNDPFHLLQFFHSVAPGAFPPLDTWNQIRHIVSLVICSNAP